MSDNRLLTMFCLACLLIPNALHAAGDSPLGEGVPPFEVRPGLRVSVAAQGIGETRFLEVDDRGTLYVSQPGAGKIISLKDQDGDGRFEKRQDFVSGYRTVHGMHFADQWLWFAQSGSIHRARDTDGDGKADDIQTVIAEGKLPSGGGHWWRSICVTGDGLFTSIGDSGNLTDERDSDRQKVWHFRLDGSDGKVWSSGVRNTEKLRVRPDTDELYGADHGSDNFGGKLKERADLQPVTDLNPPCEFNHYIDGGFYGHPFVVGNKVPRIEFQERKDILQLADKTTPPAWNFGAHWAPNGWTFLAKDSPIGRRGDAVVAMHGSWNSQAKVGYRLEAVRFDDWTGRPFGGQKLVGTLINGDDVLARPCDVVDTADGSLLFSSDSNQTIYRLSAITPAN